MRIRIHRWVQRPYSVTHFYENNFVGRQKSEFESLRLFEKIPYPEPRVQILVFYFPGISVTW